MRTSMWRAIAWSIVLGWAPAATRAQTVVPQPRGESVAVELWSILDEVEIKPGDLTDPPYIYRAWNKAPFVRTTESRPISWLRILDRTLTSDDERASNDSWDIELMPARPVRFDLRLEGGRGRFDFTGMRLRSVDLHSSSATIVFELRAPNPERMEHWHATVQSGELDVRRLLDANPRRVHLDLPRSDLRLELAGEPQSGEMEIVVQGAPASVRFAVPSDLPMRVEGEPGVLQAFGKSAWGPEAGGLQSSSFVTAPFRVRLRCIGPMRQVTVQWTRPLGNAGTPEVVVAPTAPVPAPEPASMPADESAAITKEADRCVGELQRALLARELVEADARLNEMRQRFPSDPRLPVLQEWRGASNLTSPASEPLRVGLQLYLLGEYSNALASFTTARRDPAVAADAEAWMRKCQSEIARLASGAESALSPQIVEKVVLQSTAPIVALQQPRAAVTRTRSGALEISGQAGDDTGLDRLEVSLNGAPLVDAGGEKLRIRPADEAAAHRMPFSLRVPLQRGENALVLTAYDRDSPSRWTSEHLTVTRLAPLWRTTPFLAALALAVFGAGAWVWITRRVKSKIAFVNRFNPYIAGLPIRDAEMLYGRERLLRNVLNTIHNNSIMLYGPRRIGKTSLQLEIKRRLEKSRDPEYRFLPVFIDLQGTTEPQFFAAVMNEILDASRQSGVRTLPAGPEAHPQGYGSREFTRDLRAVINSLQACTEKRLKLVLLLDEVDELNKYSEQTNQKLRSVFMKTFAESLVAVMSGTHIEKRWRSEGSPWYNFFEEIEVQPLDHDEAVRLIRAPVQGIFTFDDDAVSLILRYSEYRPYAIQRFCVHAINHIIDSKRRRVRAADVEAVRQHTMDTTEEAA